MQRASLRAKRSGPIIAATLTVGVVAAYGVYQHRTMPTAHFPSQHIRVTAAATATPNAYAEAIALMQRQPLYHQAQAACSRKQYRHAADLLGQLLHMPRLSAAETDFIADQRDVCLRDAGLRIAPTRPKHPTPKHPTPEPLTPQQADCGPRALTLVCNQLGIRTSLPQLRQRAGTTGHGTSLAGLAVAARSLGVRAEGVQVSREALPDIATPALAYVNGNHYVALLGLRGRGEQGTAVIHDPNQPREETISQERLLRLSSGYLLLVHR